MTTKQLYQILGVIYIAPHLPAWLGFAAALALALASMFDFSTTEKAPE